MSNKSVDCNNAYGLIDGKIPMGNPCPFSQRCTLMSGRCPGIGCPRQADFSCAIARLFSSIVDSYMEKLEVKK